MTETMSIPTAEQSLSARASTLAAFAERGQRGDGLGHAGRFASCQE